MMKLAGAKALNSGDLGPSCKNGLVLDLKEDDYYHEETLCR